MKNCAGMLNFSKMRRFNKIYCFTYLKSSWLIYTLRQASFRIIVAFGVAGTSNGLILHDTRYPWLMRIKRRLFHPHIKIHRTRRPSRPGRRSLSRVSLSLRALALSHRSCHLQFFFVAVRGALFWCFALL